MTEAEIQAKATIAAALIQSRAVDPEGLCSGNKAISDQKMLRLKELTDRIYMAIAQ
jgi:hypothetical protein